MYDMNSVHVLKKADADPCRTVLLSKSFRQTVESPLISPKLILQQIALSLQTIVNQFTEVLMDHYLGMWILFDGYY